ncbi:hypothetical protein NE237_031558 [Protea cynaroides]|uniref:RING-type E3 ubiquitin transferase n=1 Tax=Protea cynaroides TaxID=273540 RepID=A0A9Q0L2P9_9MAGN|nr:hypothetical protein NE237_031558 [Protea cynaroides]
MASDSNAIVISVIVSLVLVILYYIIAGWVFRYNSSRTAGTDHQLSTGTRVTQVGSGETPKKGLDQSIISALPIFIYKDLPGHNATRSSECAICLSSLEKEEMVMVLPNCKHMFHAECINTWLNSHTTCPICRSDVKPQSILETREASVVVLIDSMNSTESSPRDASDEAGESSKMGEIRSFCCMGMLNSERSERRFQVEDPENQ